MMNKVGKARQCLPGPARTFVRGDADAARRPQQLLPTIHLTGQCVAHPGDQRRFLGEVGDDRGHVRSTRQIEKCCTTLEVDEKQIEHLRRVARHHAQRDGAQQLRLARPGGAHAEPVWAHTVLGGLLDIQFERRAVGRGSDRDTEPIAVSLGCATACSGRTDRRRRARPDVGQPGRRARRLRRGTAGQPARTYQRVHGSIWSGRTNASLRHGVPEHQRCAVAAGADLEHWSRPRSPSGARRARPGRRSPPRAAAPVPASALYAPPPGCGYIIRARPTASVTVGC